jgi:hypothetical protein
MDRNEEHETIVRSLGLHRRIGTRDADGNRYRSLSYSEADAWLDECSKTLARSHGIRPMTASEHVGALLGRLPERSWRETSW